MQRTAYLVMIFTLVFSAATSAQSNIDPEHKWAWSENCGWTNWQHNRPDEGDGIVVFETHLAGYAWGENIGWINLGNGNGPYENDMDDSSTFGVNLAVENGELAGFAWAENIGWLNFEGGALADPPNPARLDGCRFRGYAWGENIGWLNLSDETHFVAVHVHCPADSDNDCDVGAADLAELLAAWGLCPGFCEPGDPADTCLADFDGDCDVDAADLAELLSAWGACLLVR